MTRAGGLGVLLEVLRLALTVEGLRPSMVNHWRRRPPHDPIYTPLARTSWLALRVRLGKRMMMGYWHAWPTEHNWTARKEARQHQLVPVRSGTSVGVEDLLTQAEIRRRYLQ